MACANRAKSHIVLSLHLPPVLPCCADRKRGSRCSSTRLDVASRSRSACSPAFERQKPSFSMVHYLNFLVTPLSPSSHLVLVSGKTRDWGWYVQFSSVGSARIGDEPRGLGHGPGPARIGDKRRGPGLGFVLALLVLRIRRRALGACVLPYGPPACSSHFNVQEC